MSAISRVVLFSLNLAALMHQLHLGLTRGHRRLTNDKFDQCQKEKEGLEIKAMFSYRN
jgi:hypothetical protein